MKEISRESLPERPEDYWLAYMGPDGSVWAEKVDEPFTLDNDQPGCAPGGWIVWNKQRGFGTVDLDTFEADYTRDTGRGRLETA